MVVMVNGMDIGTHLTRTFGLFVEQPLTMSDATAQGFSQFGNSSCDPLMGYQYSSQSSGPTNGSESWISYTAAGQLNGFGVRVFPGSSSPFLSQQLIDSNYWRPSGAGDGAYDLFFSTRDPSLVCSGNTAPELIGDRLTIWDVQSIALNMSTAQGAGWVEGNCINKMGIHHAYDLNKPGTNTWNWQSLVPVQPMYDSADPNHRLNAVLVNVPNVQFVEPFGEMEGPFLPGLFCLNWCSNTGCGWSGTNWWSTIHFHLVPIDSISCTGAPCML